MMAPVWTLLLKILVLLFVVFTTIFCISSEISKRLEAEHEAKKLMDLLCTRISKPSNNSDEHIIKLCADYKAKDVEELLHSVFVVNDKPGLILFNNTTTADSAPLMPITTMHDDAYQNQNQSPIPQPNSHYHQYHSLNQPDQSFKVQRSPDGKLNLVFNETFLSLQGTNSEVQSDQPARQHRPFDSKISVTQRHQPCGNSSNQASKSFCIHVDDYPDLSSLKHKLEKNFSKFFSDELQPTDVSARVGSDDLTYLCNSNRRYMYPKKGLKSDNTWQLIVNNEEYKQAIQIEECEGAGEPCQFTSNFPQSYKPTCTQHYVLRNLASIKNDGNLDVVQETFQIPSCCKCGLKTH
ncbi:protein spaetzle isoform X2 [Drosophila ficusphila]|uniref:protein spaetzle isoform X2 n=1 Tax=Drosophila ficusphila TaxID=30025 RepID=UPI0007E85547|nr:protein spaetzle isoform X2 [Drosophila ficusphila]